MCSVATTEKLYSLMSKEENEISSSAANDSHLLPDVVLDASGLYCPEPVMMIHNKIREMRSLQTLKIIATDPSTKRDIPKFCVFLGHELLSSSEQNQVYSYLIRKKGD